MSTKLPLVAARPRPAAHCGFTLVELMICIVIIALLATIAIPSYQTHVRETRRAAAQADLAEISSRQEQFYVNNRTYTTNIGAGGLNHSTSSEGGFYAYSVVDPPDANCPIDRCYELEAVPQGAQTADGCGTLSLDSGDERAPSGCW